MKPIDFKSKITIRKAEPKDASSIAAIHCDSMKDFLLPALGYEYLASCYWPKILKYKRKFEVFGAYYDDELVGFCAMAHDSEFVKKVSFKAQCNIVSHLLNLFVDRPKFIIDMLAMLFKRHSSIDKKFELKNLPELFALGVNPTIQNLGIGSRLLDESLQTISKRPLKVRTSSLLAKKFYIRHGFCEVGKEQRGTTSIDVLVIS